MEVHTSNDYCQKTVKLEILGQGEKRFRRQLSLYILKQDMDLHQYLGKFRRIVYKYVVIACHVMLKTF